MNNVFLFDPDTMICTWNNYLDINEELVIGKFECKSDFRDNIVIATKKLVNDSLYKSQSSNWRSIKFLKSHLQKCVRRMKSKLAVESAAEIMRLDMNHFLRRLPIIIIEDVDLVKQLPTTIWLMIAYSKGYKLRDKDVSWLLGVVKALAKCPERTIVDNKKERIFNQVVGHIGLRETAVIHGSRQDRCNQNQVGNEITSVDPRTLHHL